MKKLMVFAVAAVLAAACSSNSTNTKYAANGQKTSVQGNKDGKYQIIDQEFDNLLAPEADYETLSAYELQACGDSYLPAKPELKDVQPKTQVVVLKESDLSTDTKRKKKVTNTTNIYYMDGPVPHKVSSTSTTTFTSSSSSSSSSSGTGGTSSYSNYESSSSSSSY